MSLGVLSECECDAQFLTSDQFTGTTIPLYSDHSTICSEPSGLFTDLNLGPVYIDLSTVYGEGTSTSSFGLNNFIDPVSSICELAGGTNSGYSFCGIRKVVVYDPSTNSELPASMYKYDAGN